jgi:hypothetical protein
MVRAVQNVSWEFFKKYIQAGCDSLDKIHTSDCRRLIHRMPGEALEDQEGRETMRSLGQNMAYLLNTLEEWLGILDWPEWENRK